MIFFCGSQWRSSFFARWRARQPLTRRRTSWRDVSRSRWTKWRESWPGCPAVGRGITISVSVSASWAEETDLWGEVEGRLRCMREKHLKPFQDHWDNNATENWNLLFSEAYMKKSNTAWLHSQSVTIWRPVEESHVLETYFLTTEHNKFEQVTWN